MKHEYGHSAVVDGSTVGDLIHGRMENIMLREPSYYGQSIGIELIKNQAEIAFSSSGILDESIEYLQHALYLVTSVLEPYLLYDKLLVDSESLESIFNYNKKYNSNSETVFNEFGELFSVQPLTERYGRQISNNVEKYIRLLNNKNIKSIFNFEIASDVEMESANVIMFKDTLMTRVNAQIFGDSCNKPHRALFYHEMANNSGLPLILHRKKREALDQLSRSLESDVIEILRRMEADISGCFKSHDIDLQMPPLAFALISKSLEEDRSLLDVAIEMKKDTEIKSLRKLLKDLHDKRDAGRLHQSLAIKKASDRITKRVIERSAFNMPALCSKTLHLSEVPALSSILKLFESGDISIPDVVLYERPYITFFDRWVNFSPA